jgi:hypothetical protein
MEDAIALFPQAWEREPAYPERLSRCSLGFTGACTDLCQSAARLTCAHAWVLARTPSTQAELQSIHFFRNRSTAPLEGTRLHRRTARVADETESNFFADTITLHDALLGLDSSLLPAVE